MINDELELSETKKLVVVVDSNTDVDLLKASFTASIETHTLYDSLTSTNIIYDSMRERG